MGNKTLSERLDIEFIRCIEDKNFGEIQLYRKTEIECIMRKTFTFANNDQQTQTLKRYINFHQNKNNIVIASLYHIETTKQKQLCIEYQKIEIYIQYYNYTFQNIIDDKKHLELHELWYLLNLFCDLAILLEKNNIGGKQFILQNIFVSLNGIPKIYLFNNIDYYSQQVQQFKNIQYIAMLIIELCVNKKLEIQNTFCAQLEEIQTKSKQLKQILSKMLNDSQFTLQNVLSYIQELVNSKKIKLSTCLKLTKYKALINQQCHQKKSVEQTTTNTSITHQNRNHSSSTRMSTTVNTNILKQLQQKKNQNTILQQKLKMRMQTILGKQNIKVTRSSTNSQKKTQRKNLPPLNWGKVSTNKKKVFI